MFGINSIRKVVIFLGDSLAKFNQTIHGGADEAAKTTECVKSGASGLITAKGVKDCVVLLHTNVKTWYVLQYLLLERLLT